MDLYNELQKLCTELDVEVRAVRKTGSEYARAYANYRIALAKELLKLKAEGYSISLAGDVARGKEDIAELKFLEISKEAIYKANLEAINATKLNIEIISAQIDRELGSLENS